MSFNIWGGGANEDKPVDDTVAAIEAVDPDIVGVQETRVEGPDCTARPAFTWRPTSKPSDDSDHHDRIDFVLARADDLEVESAAIVGERRPEADIVVRPWPSDHRAVTATVRY